MAEYQQFVAVMRRWFSVIATQRKRTPQHRAGLAIRAAMARTVARVHRYGEGLGATEAEAEAEADADATADPEADGLPDTLGAADKLGSGAGVGAGKRVVGTLARERAKIRMKMTSTISTHGRASESVRGGSDPR